MKEMENQLLKLQFFHNSVLLDNLKTQTDSKILDFETIEHFLSKIVRSWLTELNIS